MSCTILRLWLAKYDVAVVYLCCFSSPIIFGMFHFLSIPEYRVFHATIQVFIVFLFWLFTEDGTDGCKCMEISHRDLCYSLILWHCRHFLCGRRISSLPLLSTQTILLKCYYHVSAKQKQWLVHSILAIHTTHQFLMISDFLTKRTTYNIRLYVKTKELLKMSWI